MQKELNKEIGVSEYLLDGNRASGVRIKETFVLTGGVDGAIVNGGSLRYSLPKGKVTKGTVQ